MKDFGEEVATLLERLAERGRQTAGDFTVENMVTSYERLYEKFGLLPMY